MMLLISAAEPSEKFAVRGPGSLMVTSPRTADSYIYKYNIICVQKTMKTMKIKKIKAKL